MTETKGEYNLPPGEDGVDSVDLADLQRQASENLNKSTGSAMITV